MLVVVDLSSLPSSLALLFVLILAYVIGSLPTAYIVGRAKAIDIREHGSGNVGATNVMRVLGRQIGFLVLLVDLLKGVLAVVLVTAVFVNSWPMALKEIHVKMLAGITAMIGHLYPVWLDFKGGKGVATATGFMLALAPAMVLVSMAVFLATVLITKIMSLASIIAALSLPLSFFIFYNFGEGLDLFIFIMVVVLFVVLKHRSNIRRILDGEETKITSFSKS